MNQITCDCAAYKFPHRLGGGACQREDESGAYCRDCGSQDIGAEDFGIGAYEFWGRKGVHREVGPICLNCDSADIGKAEDWYADMADQAACYADDRADYERGL